jgi:1,4-alpha-glucan branching enzyme
MDLMKTTGKKANGEASLPAVPRRLVRFRYVNPLAKSVYLAGTFNQWRPDLTEMFRVGENYWIQELMLSPGPYQYRFVVDGQWVSDPTSVETGENLRPKRKAS